MAVRLKSTDFWKFFRRNYCSFNNITPKTDFISNLHSARPVGDVKNIKVTVKSLIFISEIVMQIEVMFLNRFIAQTANESSVFQWVILELSCWKSGCFESLISLNYFSEKKDQKNSARILSKYFLRKEEIFRVFPETFSYRELYCLLYYETNKRKYLLQSNS